MIKPETVKKLQEERPELQELRAHLVEEAAKLNRLDDLHNSELLSVEVLARLRAFQTIKAMLEPLVNVENPLNQADPKEYVV